jgi:hypothetical protein
MKIGARAPRGSAHALRCIKEPAMFRGTRQPEKDDARKVSAFLFVIFIFQKKETKYERKKQTKILTGYLVQTHFSAPAADAGHLTVLVEDGRVLSEACGALEATWPRRVHSGAKKAERTFGMSSSNEDDPARHG